MAYNFDLSFLSGGMMANLESDIVGQVARLPLKPNEANALLPLHEAISNALHAIHDRFGDSDLATKGRIDIEIIRSEAISGDDPVVGFRVTDNGIGLNASNYKSFCTPFSQHKLKRGGKGVGRLGWLKVFNNINIQSRFIDSNTMNTIEFDFILRDENQIAIKKTTDILLQDIGTVITMKNFLQSYGGKCPVKTSTIIQRIIAHFLPIFAGDKSPKIYVIDGHSIDIRDEFKEKIKTLTDDILEIDIDGEKQPILVRHMRCDKSIRPRGTTHNWLCFCANDRGV